MRSLILCAVVVAALTSGCAASLVKELAKDPATACVELNANYLVAALSLKWFRSGVASGSAACGKDGMAVDTRALPALPK